MKTNTKRLAITAVMIALSAVSAIICDLIPVPPFRFPFGGGITIVSMLPIVILSYVYSVKWGLFSGLCYSVVKMAFSGLTISGMFIATSDDYAGSILKAFLICFLDYVVAYTVIGFGGIFKGKFKGNKRLELALGAVVALTLRYIVHIISGAIFYGTYAEWFFTESEFAALSISNGILSTFSGAGLSVVYSAVYNGCYMIPEIILTAVVAALCANKVTKLNKA